MLELDDDQWVKEEGNFKFIVLVIAYRNFRKNSFMRNSSFKNQEYTLTFSF